MIDVNPYRELNANISPTEFEVFCLNTLKAYAEKENLSSFSHEERLSINQNLGKYNGLRVKHYAEDAGKAIQEFSESLPYWLEGFLSAFE